MRPDDPVAVQFRTSVETGDAAAVQALFAECPELHEVIDEPWFSFGGHALGEAAAHSNVALVDVLLDLGADADALSNWPNGPYSALHRLVDGATPERLALADHIAARGATVDLHAAAGMGRFDRIRELLASDPESVNAPGPDGATALHLARDADVAQLLIARGADVNQRCVDHLSTPIMWAVADRPDVVRVLLEHGATTDLFIAAFFDDAAMAEAILDQDPSAIEVRVRYGQSHPHVGGGDKYVWTLDGAQTPVELARRRGSSEVYALLLGRSSPAVRLSQAGLRGDLEELGALLDEHPDLLGAAEHGLALHEAIRSDAVVAAFLLGRGADPNVVDDETGATPLHHAAWRGLESLARVLLEGGADPYRRDGNYDATPLGWANEAGNGDMMTLLAEEAPPDIVDAAWMGDAERVREILEGSPELVDGFDNGRISPLRSAAWCGKIDVVRVLLEHGARPDLPHPEHGKTALDYAAERGHAGIVQLLSETP